VPCRLRRGFLLIVTSWTICAQDPAPSDAFEAASVRRSKTVGGRGAQSAGMSGGPGTADPGQFHAFGTPIWALILLAYHIPPYQVVGPEWLKSERFDVVAKVPGRPTRQEFNAMLQNLLAERFRLTAHRERREMPAYNLVIAKGGPKLKKVADDSQSNDDVVAGASVPAKFTLGSDGYPVLQLEPGATSGTAMAHSGRLTDWMGKLTMEQFAAIMSARTGRPVNDRTGLKGRYDITLRFWFDLGSAANDPRESGDPQDPLDAMQSQLGLRLETTKAIVEILVIDHAEKVPTEN
jgi:uncharacterized protein (TIGR03435 family)